MEKQPGERRIQMSTRVVTFPSDERLPLTVTWSVEVFAYNVRSGGIVDVDRSCS